LLRFAISPIKDLGVKELRVAILNYIISQQTNEELLIRIDDTEKEKNIEKKDKEIIKLLDLFGIKYSRIILQSENIKYHTGMGMKLLLDKKSFNCFCTEEVLEEDKVKAQKEEKPYSYSGFCETISDETKFHCNAPFVVRLKKPNKDIKFTDFVQGDCEFKPYEVDSVVVLKHDKTPTANFASAVDDMLYDISTIITNENQLINTSKQIHIRKSLDYEKEIKYTHLPKILNSKTAKELSITDNYSSINWLINEGYLPIAIANYLVHLGFSTPNEIFTLEEAVEWFDLNRLSTKSASFDITKLNHINKEHLKTIDNMRLSKIIGYADEDIGKLAKLYLKECNTTKELKEKIDLIFTKKETLKEFEEEIKTLKTCLTNAPFMNDFAKLQEYIIEKTGIKDETPLRFILTGTTSGLKLKKIYPLIKNYLGEIIC